MTPFAVAGIQMHITAGCSNIEAMRHKLDLLMTRFPWVQMAVFSELCVFGSLSRNAQPLPGPIEDDLREMAARHDIWLIPGSLFEKAEEKIYNTALVINPAGEVVGRYRKMFPFRPYENGVESGSEFMLFDIADIGRFGVSICYDMWFPETSRTLAAMGAEVIIHPSMTDTIDRDVELSIARATAVTNQCYFIDINGVGDGGVGRSIVVGPSGYTIHEARGGEELMPVELNLDRVRRERHVGIRGLGQPLKSFRDRPLEFPAYERGGAADAYLESLGPVAKPARGSRAGLEPKAHTAAPEPAAGSKAPVTGSAAGAGTRSKSQSLAGNAD
jgi:predicted amidohydrolase